MYYKVTHIKTKEQIEFYTEDELEEFLESVADRDIYSVQEIVPCKGCQSEDTYEREDAYGFSTGYWCDSCYENNYPYRKDSYYDYLDAGEMLDDDY